MATLVQGENRIPRPGIDSASAVLPNFAIGKRLYNKVRLVLPAFGFQQGQILVGVVRRCSQVNHLETGPQTRLEDFSHSILRQNVKAIDEGSAKNHNPREVFRLAVWPVQAAQALGVVLHCVR